MRVAEFDFITEYRARQPSQSREMVEARAVSFAKLKTALDEDANRIADLAHFAYSIPHALQSDADSWLEETLRANDNTFTISQDREEAALLAALVLRERLSRNVTATPVIVHAASFVGKRPTADKGALSAAARQRVQDQVRRRGTSTTQTKVSQAKAAEITALIEKYREVEDTASEIAILEGVNADYNAQITQVAKTANKAIEAVFNENRRLAEEIDLLWWHLGQYSLLLDRPLSEIPELARPIVIGLDIAEMVNILPGPFGVYGIMRKALGDLASKQLKLSETIKALDPDFDGIVGRIENYGLAPIHGACGEVLLDGAAVSPAQFKRKTGLNFDLKLTAFEVAMQSYHEGMLYKLDWLK